MFIKPLEGGMGLFPSGLASYETPDPYNELVCFARPEPLPHLQAAVNTAPVDPFINHLDFYAGMPKTRYLSPTHPFASMLGLKRGHYPHHLDRGVEYNVRHVNNTPDNDERDVMPHNRHCSTPDRHYLQRRAGVGGWCAPSHISASILPFGGWDGKDDHP